MHDCMKIEELVQMIFAHLELPIWGSNADSTALAALARTCTIFCSPALDLLWAKQETLVNLLRCMPTDLIEITPPTAVSESKITLLRPIRARDWKRPLFYAPRVKEFQYPFTHIGHTSLFDIFPALSLSLPTECVFPNLTRLSWFPRNDADFPNIYLFITGALTSITIICTPSSCNLSVLAGLARKCRALKDVSIHILSPYAPTLPSSVHSSLSEFVQELLVVQNLRIFIPDLSAFQHIGRLETLRTWEIPSLPLFLSSAPLIDLDLFRNLKHLIISMIDVEIAAIHFLQSARASFELLTLTFCDFPMADTTSAFYSVLSQCILSHSSLESMILIYPDPESDNNPIFSAFGFDLNDVTVADMARAWPRLKTLDLLSVDRPARQRVTLDGLRSLSRYCPLLQSLEMTFDASVVPEMDPAVAPIGPQQLTWLFVGHSRILGPAAVAQFISSIFPSVTRIPVDTRGNEPEEIARQARWKEVESQLRAHTT
ncbi:hypothetical protein B0H17DRAFT_1340988 [Mycena rosella]|uniref:F-box domain-containing protein n=1 Tax=Mycena rosella TaxID=1033263 RepID=A0AAD7BCW4_MYCRO|nr:hypothetical protein B0H17DRAFT_1340988 [Mycena rosella]